jgi:hypothetical protein
MNSNPPEPRAASIDEIYRKGRQDRMVDTILDYMDDVDGIQSLLHDIVLACKEQEKYHSDQLFRYARLRKLVS